ncbi:hypothetical protein BGX31_004491 [Mortierella sp. GBA43]|nr:hypothetical protein BGX31_004491 [Mortierella sp. GBA43]
MLDCPTGYFEHRGITLDSKQGIMDEWDNWMLEFSQTQSKVLRDVSGKLHSAEADAQTVLANAIVKHHKINCQGPEGGGSDPTHSLAPPSCAPMDVQQLQQLDAKLTEIDGKLLQVESDGEQCQGPEGGAFVDGPRI